MAKTIYMIHGLWTTSWYWNNYITFFEKQGWNCIAPTLRHHEHGPNETADPRLAKMGLQDFADHIENDIQSLDEPPIILGHSMGGLLAQIVAARGLGSKLVLLNPAAPGGIIAVTGSVLRSFLSYYFNWGFWRKTHMPTYKEVCYSTFNNLQTEEEKQDIYSRFVQDSGKVIFEAGLWPFDKKKASFVDENKISIPIYVIGSKLDRITPASITQKIARKYNASYKEFQNNAHLTVLEPGWEEVASYIAECLGDN